MSVSGLDASCCKAPVPLMSLATVTLSERLKASVALSITAPVPRVPTVALLPTCRTPAVTVVVPE